MNTTKKAAIAVMLAILPASSLAADQADPLYPFPSPEAGQRRTAIHLPQLEHEENYKVEILVGKTIQVDGCNHYLFRGSLEERTVTGWGYTYWVLPRAEGPMHTLMACAPSEPRRNLFVLVGGGDHLVRYNSRLPVVIYVPADFEVRYRLWQAREEIGEATEE